MFTVLWSFVAATFPRPPCTTPDGASHLVSRPPTPLLTWPGGAQGSRAIRTRARCGRRCRRRTPRAVPLDGDARMHRQMETHVRGWGANQGGEAWEWAPFADDDLARCVNLGAVHERRGAHGERGAAAEQGARLPAAGLPSPPEPRPAYASPCHTRTLGVAAPRPSVVEVCPTNSNRVCWFLIVVLGTPHLPLSPALPLPTPTAPLTAVIKGKGRDVSN